MSILHNLNIYESEISGAETLCADIADSINKNYDDIEEAVISHIMEEGIDFNDFTNIVNSRLMEETKQEILCVLEENGIPAECADIQHDTNGMCLYFSINNENINSGTEARQALNDVAFDYRKYDNEVRPIVSKCENLLIEAGYDEETALDWLDESVKERIDNEFDFWEYNTLDLANTYMQQTVEMVKDAMEEDKITARPQITCDDSNLYINGKEYQPDTDMLKTAIKKETQKNDLIEKE